MKKLILLSAVLAFMSCSRQQQEARHLKGTYSITNHGGDYGGLRFTNNQVHTEPYFTPDLHTIMGGMFKGNNTFGFDVVDTNRIVISNGQGDETSWLVEYRGGKDWEMNFKGVKPNGERLWIKLYLTEE